MARLSDVLAVLDGWYPQGDAESWDAVGLVCGDPDVQVTRLLLAIDAVPTTVEAAADRGAQLLLTHHPLFLSGVHGVAANEPKGALVHRMIRAGVAHFVAHTNAEVNTPGVSDALADALGLRDVAPLQPVNDPPLDKLTVFVARPTAEAMIDALSAAGAGHVGEYDRCAFTVEGVGTFRPGDAATPTIGRAGRIETVDEARVEMVLEPGRRRAVLAAMHAAHPYEQPAFDLVTHTPIPGRRGVGRIGSLATSTTLAEFVAFVADRLPATTWGVRASGEPSRPVKTVAVLGGSGSSLVDRARAAGADVFVTADLKHHNAVEAVTQRLRADERSREEKLPAATKERGPEPVDDQRTGGEPMALIDAAHWATEVPWLHTVAGRLRQEFGDTVGVEVCDVVTDPWTVHVPSVRRHQPASEPAAPAPAATS